jgi:hypothetical protein
LLAALTQETFSEEFLGHMTYAAMTEMTMASLFDLIFIRHACFTRVHNATHFRVCDLYQVIASSDTMIFENYDHLNGLGLMFDSQPVANFILHSFLALLFTINC